MLRWPVIYIYIYIYICIYIYEKYALQITISHFAKGDYEFISQTEEYNEKK